VHTLDHDSGMARLLDEARIVSDEEAVDKDCQAVQAAVRPNAAVRAGMYQGPAGERDT
jgi:hypothetical protein